MSSYPAFTTAYFWSEGERVISENRFFKETSYEHVTVRPFLRPIAEFIAVKQAVHEDSRKVDETATGISSLSATIIVLLVMTSYSICARV